MDVDGEVPELRALASHFAAKGGALWAAEADGTEVGGAVVGMVAAVPEGARGEWHIERMYTQREARGRGLAQSLLDVAEGHARGHGATRLVLHSDTRFDRAHRFYEKHSYLRDGPIRVLNDLSNSIEFGLSLIHI